MLESRLGAGKRRSRPVVAAKMVSWQLGVLVVRAGSQAVAPLQPTTAAPVARTLKLLQPAVRPAEGEGDPRVVHRGRQVRREERGRLRLGERGGQSWLGGWA